VALAFTGCGPNPKPSEPCDGPTFNLLLKAAQGPLPPDTRLVVKYGGNNDGEPYALGETPSPQVVFCSEKTASEGGATASEGGATASEDSGETPNEGGVYSLFCRLYTQGPARVDVTATGYEAIEERDLTLGKKRCLVDVELELTPLPPPDAAAKP